MEYMAEALQVAARQRHAQPLAQHIADHVRMAETFPLDGINGARPGRCPSSRSSLMLVTIAMLPLLDLRSMRLRLAKNLPATRDLCKHATVFRQLFVRADYQITAVTQRRRNAADQSALSFDVEISKDEVAAQDQIKGAGRDLGPDVLE